MALVTIAELKEHIETDLSDTALQRIIDANDAMIIARFGALVAETETRYFGMVEVSSAMFWLARMASAVTSAIETIGTTDTTLSADDYSLDSNGMILRRLATGTNGAEFWGEKVIVQYVPQDKTAQRTLALVNLCRIDIITNGLKLEATGDYKAVSADYSAEREKIIAELGGRWWA